MVGIEAPFETRGYLIFPLAFFVLLSSMCYVHTYFYIKQGTHFNLEHTISRKL